METPAWSPALPPGVRELPVVGGHLALDFANTVDDPGGHEEFDHLPDYAGLLRWAHDREVLGEDQAAALAATARAHPRLAKAAVTQARSLRAAVNDTFGAVVQGAAPDRGWERVRQFSAVAVQRATVAPGSPPLRMSWDFHDLESPLWPVAEAAYRLLTGPELRRLKQCGGCPWLFLDSSKNGSRRWCAMEDCGTHAKIVRYVAKRAERRMSLRGDH
jgi:predicted RNA-binding Zn ribbon-like protein